MSKGAKVNGSEVNGVVPSGKLSPNYGKSPFFQVNQLFLWPFSIAFCMFTRLGRVFHLFHWHFAIHVLMKDHLRPTSRP